MRVHLHASIQLSLNPWLDLTWKLQQLYARGSTLWIFYTIYFRLNHGDACSRNWSVHLAIARRWYSLDLDVIITTTMAIKTTCSCWNGLQRRLIAARIGPSVFHVMAHATDKRLNAQLSPTQLSCTKSNHAWSSGCAMHQIRSLHDLVAFRGLAQSALASFIMQSASLCVTPHFISQGLGGGGSTVRGSVIIPNRLFYSHRRGGSSRIYPVEVLGSVRRR